jgi:hypothetical protein
MPVDVRERAEATRPSQPLTLTAFRASASPPVRLWAASTAVIGARVTLSEPREFGGLLGAKTPPSVALC